jgi:hypothetical protein
MHRLRFTGLHTGADGDEAPRGKKRVRDALTDADINGLVEGLEESNDRIIARIKNDVQKEIETVKATSNIEKKAESVIASAVTRLTQQKLALENFLQIKENREDGLTQKMHEYIKGKKKVETFGEDIQLGLGAILNSDDRKLAEKCAGYLNLQAKIASLSDQADEYDLDEEKKEFLDLIDSADDRSAAFVYLKHHGTTKPVFAKKMRDYLKQQRTDALKTPQFKSLLDKAKEGKISENSEYLTDKQIVKNPEIYIYQKLAEAKKNRQAIAAAQRKEDEKKKKAEAAAKAAENKDKAKEQAKKRALGTANAEFKDLIKLRKELEELKKRTQLPNGTPILKLFIGGKVPDLNFNQIDWLDEMPEDVADAINIKEELTAELQKIGAQVFLVPKAGESLQRISLAIQNLQGNAGGAEEGARKLLAEMNNLLAGSKS